MASHKKHSEGIALLSIYGDDEDDEMEDVDDSPPPPPPPAAAAAQGHELVLEAEEQQISRTLTPVQYEALPASDYYNFSNHNENDNEDNGNRVADGNTISIEVQQLQQPVVEIDDFAPKGSSMGPSSSPRISFTSPQQEIMVPVLQSNRSRTGRLAIVDYGHDEMAMSPEAEEGEILATGRVMYGEELQTANGDFPPGTIQGPPPGTRASPSQSSDHNELPESNVADYTVEESKVVEIVEVDMITSEETKDVDPLDKFLPPPPKEKCSEELQDKIRKFLTFKRIGRSFNAEVRNRKEYRNPDFLLHAVTYQDIDQIGSCFRKDVFNPHGYEKIDFYDQIETDMRREMEWKEQERKKNQKVDFTPGGTQPGTLIPTPKINLPIPGLSAVPAARDVLGRDGRQNKKSKWDKVDGDQTNPLSTGGQDPMSAVAANAALLSAANAGTGYSAFAQQRRREAEDKRSSDRKLERRS